MRTRLWLGLVVFLIAGVGQSLLAVPARRTIAVLLLAIAAVAGVAVWRKCRDSPLLPATSKWRGNPVVRRPQLLARVGGLGIAMLLLAGSIAAYLAEPQAVFGRQGALWLASIALFVVCCARWGVAGHESEPGQAWSRGEKLGLLGLIVLAVVARVLFLEQIPWRFAPDESLAYAESMHYYRGPPVSLFTTLWLGTSLPSLWFVVPGLLMKIVGPGLAGVRSGVALVSGLAVIPIYLLARLVWGRVAALVAGFTMAISAVYVHYSRVSINNVTTAVWWSACFYFLLRGLRSRRPIDFAWAGLAAGTSMYTYYGTRLLPLVLVAFLLYLCAFHFGAFRARIGQFAILGLGFFIGFGPLIGYFIQQPEMWAGRGLQYLNVPTLLPTTWQGWVDNWDILAPLLFRNFLGLGVLPGQDTVYYLPFLLPFEAALVVLGAALLIWRWRQPASFLVLLWALSVVFTGGTLLSATTVPNFAHWAPAFPAFFLALALPVALWLEPIFQAARPVLRAAGAALLATLLVADLAANAHTYLVRYPPLVPPDESLHTIYGRFLASVGDARVRIVGYTWWDPRPEVAAMMAPHTPVTYLLNPSRELPVVGDPERDLAFVVFNDMTAYLSVLREYYPDGELRELRPPNGPVLAHGFIVPKAFALERHGVLATFVTGGSGGAVQWTGKVGAVGAVPTGSQLSYPLDAIWTGAFYHAEGGPALLSLAGADRSSITVLGRPVSIGTPVQLEPGWVPFSVRARLRSPAHLRLLIERGDDQPAAEIETNRLWPASPEQGLEATLSSTSLSYRIDPFLGASVKRPLPRLDPDVLPLVSMVEGDTRIRWEGQVLTMDGPHTMQIRTDSPVELTIDGHVVISRCKPSSAAGVLIGSARLAAGWHDVRVDYQASGPRGTLEWFWNRPDGTFEAVPPSALRHGRDDLATFPEAPEPIACVSAVETLGGRSGLSEPRGVAADSRGRLFVGDSGHHRVVRIENGEVAASWGHSATEPGLGRFGALSDLAVAADGHVATVDQQTGDVTLFDADGKVERHLPGISSNASGIELDDAGTIWVADTGNSRILRIGPDGAVSAIWTGEGGGFERLEQPLDVVVDARGVVYAVDLRHRIVRFAADGRIDAQWEVEIGRQRGGSHLAWSAGRVLMTQPDRGLLVVLDPATGGMRNLATESLIPLSIDGGADGRTYVLDSAAALVYVYDALE